MSKNEEKQLYEKFAKFLYVSGTPLSITENPYCQSFFKSLRPAFNLPSRKNLSGPLLEQAYNSVKSQVEEKIQNSPFLGIQTDD